MNGDNKGFHDLIEKLNSGDLSAFDEIYARSCKHIAFVCSKFCDNKEDVEEVLQDTYLIAFKKAGELFPYSAEIEFPPNVNPSRS